MRPRIDDSTNAEPFTRNPQQSMRLSSLHKGGKLRPREGKWHNEGPSWCALFPGQVDRLVLPAEPGHHGRSHPPSPQQAKSGLMHHSHWCL